MNTLCLKGSWGHSGMRKTAYIWAAVSFGLGFALHFAYEWSGLTMVGLFCPVNESVWEHLKLAFFPLAAWWLIYGKKTGMPVCRRVMAAAVSACAAALLILLIHYTVSGVFGREMVAVDIAALAVSLFAGQYLALRALEKERRAWAWKASAAALVLLGAMMAVFTFCPPRLPIFLDREGGFYGIQR